MPKKNWNSWSRDREILLGELTNLSTSGHTQDQLTKYATARMEEQRLARAQAKARARGFVIPVDAAR